MLEVKMMVRGWGVLAGAALAAWVTVASPVAAQTSGAKAIPTPLPLPSAAPAATPVAIPTPITALPPASRPSTLPYPAYGSPAPGVDRGVQVAGIKPVVSLDEAMKIAFATSPLLAQARAAVGIAKAPVDLAKSALLPSIGLSGSTLRTDREAGSSTGGVSSLGDSFTSNALTATMRQLVYDGGKIFAQYRAAKDNKDAAVDQYQRQLQTVAYNVANAYWAALAAQRQTAVAVETVRVNQVNEDLVTAQLRAGVASRVDLATAQLPTAQARVALVKAQGAELSAQAAFVNALGLDVNTYVLPKDDGNVLGSYSSATNLPIPTYEQAIARAIAQRPDYAAAIATTNADKASVRAARLGTYPNLSATASNGTSSTNLSGGSYRNASQIGVSLTFPIFDQGVTAAQTAQAQAVLDQAQATYLNTKLALELNVKQSLVNLITARATFDQTQAELAKAQEVLQATQAQYAAGVTTLPLLLNAQVGLTQALTDQVTAVYNLRQAEATFAYAEGTNGPA
jgi:outer membrane protein